MPHIIIKLHPGRDLDTKQKLTDEIVESVVRVAGCSESAVSVAFEEISAENWEKFVYRPDIEQGKGQLLKKPAIL